MKNQITKQEKERLGNKLALVTSATILYALLLLFIQEMASSTMTVNGAISLISLLRWTSLCGAMGCAAWSAYKEKKGFFLYCAMCIFVFFSTTILLFTNASKAYPINYIALAVAFVMSIIYYNLKMNGKFGGAVKKIFIIIAIVIIVALGIYAIPDYVWASIPFLKK